MTRKVGRAPNSFPRTPCRPITRTSSPVGASSSSGAAPPPAPSAISRLSARPLTPRPRAASSGILHSWRLGLLTMSTAGLPVGAAGLPPTSPAAAAGAVAGEGVEAGCPAQLLAGVV